MPCVIVHVQFHQPFRLHPDGDKFLWEQTQRSIMAAAADRYLPVVRVLTGLTSQHPAFRVTLNASGAFLEQAETYSPPVIRALQDLLDGGKAAGQVEFLEEPYYHSLCGLFGDPLKKEFRDQVAQHRQKMKEVFGYRPAGFVNTELFYTADLANVVADMDYKVMLCEPRPDLQVDPPEERPWRRGIYHVRGRRKRPRDLLVLMRRRSWSERFLRSLAQPDADPEAFARELAQTDEDTVLLGIDPASDRSDPADGDAWAASLGAHLLAFIRQEQIRLATCQEAADHYKDLQCPVIESPQTGPKNPSDWERISLGRMASATQYALFGEIESLEAEARAAGGALLSQWRHLTGANHVFYLRESAGTADPAEAAESSCSNPAVGGQTDDRGVPGGGILHDYRNPYGSPAAAAYVLTRKLDRLQNSIRMFNIRKKTGQTAV
ncbi:MAG: hypothetical protein JW810_01705, partial [Sedimentisphaerales bacterium]|nr:hypothetical protein [Sedimentisphaerales bacterium]